MYSVGETLLKIDRVSLSYGTHQILSDVCAEVKDLTRPDCVQGQVVCFLGPSGIGKTQLGRVIAGLQAPTSGTVTLENGKPVHCGDVGMVPQNYPLFAFTTVRQNLLIAGKQAGLSAAAAWEKARGYIDTLGLWPYVDFYPKDLSGGTRQRVAIVRQLLSAGHLLIMDEPFSGLDLVMKQRACDLITHVANLDERNTIIVVTHDVTEGMSVADTVWLMGRRAPGAGATILERFDLAAQGLCWHPDLTRDAAFLEAVRYVKDRFLAIAEVQ